MAWQRLVFWIRLGLLAGLACLLGTAQAHLVCVVSGDKAAAFQEASDSLIQELGRSGIARQDIEVLSVAQFLEGNQHMADNKLIVSLGTDAFRQVSAHSGKTLVLAGLIPRIAFERVLQEANKKTSGTAAALYLDQPFGRQLDLLRLALPAVRHIGVVWGPESITQQPLLGAALQARGLDVSEGLVGDNTPLITALRSALNDAEVLLAVADGNVFNPSTVSNILLTSYRAKTAVMAFSPAYVKAGALLAVYSSAAQAGAQLGNMASHFLQSGTVPSNQYPLDFSISGNEYVARSLGISLDVKALAERLHKLEKKP